MLQKETVDKETFDLMQNIFKEDLFRNFYLVGGTALSLQIGHRKSIDIDLFTHIDFDTSLYNNLLIEKFGYQIDFVAKNTSKGTINNIKIDIISHKYKLIDNPICTEDIKLLSEKDISAMKLNAISNDGTRVKDFIDFYYLLKKYPLKDQLNFYQEKYSQTNTTHILKSLAYFDQVDINNWPVMIKNKELSWNEVTDTINKSINDYFKSETINR